MSITDSKRTDIHNCLRDLMGHDMADIMMEFLPPVGWGEVVRRQDVNSLGVALRSEMSVLGSDLRTEIAGVRNELKAEIAEVRTELTAEIAAVRNELKTEIAGVRNELKAEIADVRNELKSDIAELRGEFVAFKQVTEVRFASLEASITSLKNTVTTLIVCNVAVFGVVLTLLWQAK